MNILFSGLVMATLHKSLSRRSFFTLHEEKIECVCGAVPQITSIAVGTTILIMKPRVGGRVGGVRVREVL